MYKKLFPYWQDKTVRNYYFTEAFMNMWFIAPVWFFVFRHFLTVSQIGINEIIAFSIGFLAEVPTGAIADKIGRRKTLIIGGVILVIGSAGTAISYNLLTIVIFQSIWFIGYAFYSGANEALVYDRLVEEKHENDWNKISARKSGMTSLITIVSVLAGGFLYVINFRLPFIVFTFAMMGFLIFTFKYPVDKPKKEVETSHKLSTFWLNIRIGMKELLQPQLRFLIYGVAAFTAIYYAYEWGVLRPLILSNHGYGGFSASVLSSILYIILFLMYLVLPKIFGGVIKEKWILGLVIAASLVFCLLAFHTSIIRTGIVIIIYTMLAETVNWCVSIHINKHLSPTHRATALSAWEMIKKIPYILLVATITNISSHGLSVFIVIISGVILLSSLITLLSLSRLETAKA